MQPQPGDRASTDKQAEKVERETRELCMDGWERNQAYEEAQTSKRRIEYKAEILTHLHFS